MVRAKKMMEEVKELVLVFSLKVASKNQSKKRLLHLYVTKRN